ncbi:MAG: M15 family metallopeptidase [Bacillota bacterium]|nr:M15 family metallopeptidase [Bacillota bacterium]
MKFHGSIIVLIISILFVGCTNDVKQMEVKIEQDIENTIDEYGNKLLSDTEPKEIFEVLDIDQEYFDLMNGKSFHENDFITINDLRLVKVTYWGFDEEIHHGELVANKIMATDLIEIFKELYMDKYPIEKIQLVSYYDGDDNLSMQANNTSAFNYRLISGTDKISNHSYGLAIDINPVQNPYVSNSVVAPRNAASYVDRTEYRTGMIIGDDICVRLFKGHGWTWGGNYKSIKDYQHFEKTIKGIND